ncbi:hypothetical protein V8E51_013221, partial [Hyaloscypha variabilis]
RISIATILVIRDTTVYKGLSILFFTLNILFILLVNVGIRVKLINRKMGKAINIVINDYNTLFIFLSHSYLFTNTLRTNNNLF